MFLFLIIGLRMNMKAEANTCSKKHFSGAQPKTVMYHNNTHKIHFEKSDCDEINIVERNLT